MKAFHNDVAVKKKYLKRVRAHQKADHLVRGMRWEMRDGEFKGCAVGCTLENYNHKAYEAELGIPEWLARVEDALFEGMSEKKSTTWPEVFLKAIPIGANLEKIKSPYMVMVLSRNLKTLDEIKAGPGSELSKVIVKVRKANTDIIALWKKYPKESAAESSAWSAAEFAAWSAAESAAWSAAEFAAKSSALSAAKSSALSAAGSAAESSALSAAKSSALSAAGSAAESAALSAAKSSALSAAGSAAESAVCDCFADELIKLLKGAK